MDRDSDLQRTKWKTFQNLFDLLETQAGRKRHPLLQDGRPAGHPEQPSVAKRERRPPSPTALEPWPLTMIYLSESEYELGSLVKVQCGRMAWNARHRVPGRPVLWHGHAPPVRVINLKNRSGVKDLL